MSIAQSLLPEFDQEMQNAGKVLERIPDEKWSWKPHVKSGTVVLMAAHIATIPEWAIMTLNTESFDDAAPGRSSYVTPKIENRQQVLTAFDKGVTETRKAIEGATDDDMTKVWSLLAGGETVFALPRVAVFRSMIMNHLIHHRAQLTVYYRLLGVPVPGSYGPSADEGQPSADAVANSFSFLKAGATNLRPRLPLCADVGHSRFNWASVTRERLPCKPRSV